MQLCLLVMMTGSGVVNQVFNVCEHFEAMFDMSACVIHVAAGLCGGVRLFRRIVYKFTDLPSML